MAEFRAAAARTTNLREQHYLTTKAARLWRPTPGPFRARAERPRSAPSTDGSDTRPSKEGHRCRKLKVHNFAISLDGYGAGPDQSVDNPLGWAGRELHEWVFETRYRPADVRDGGRAAGTTGVDDDFFARGDVGIGATDHGAQHVRARSAGRGATTIGPAGGATTRRTTTRCSCSPTTPGRRSRWRAARRSTSSTTASRPRSSERSTPPAARTSGSAEVRARSSSTSGPASSTRCTSRSCPSLLGGGERLFDNLDGGPDGYEVVEFVSSPSVLHACLARTS